MLAPEALNQLLAELEPTIHLVAVRTRRYDRCNADLEDAKQVLRELVIRQSDKLSVSSQALRVCILKAAAIDRIRSDRSREARDARFSDVDPAERTHAGGAEAVLEATKTVDRICEVLAELSSGELKTFTDRLDGAPSAETAQELGVSHDTVRYYRARILEKLALALRAEGGSSEDVEALVEALHANFDVLNP